MQSPCYLVPPGGWYFQQGSTLIKSETYDLLLKDIRTHRINNKIEIGDIEKEVEEQINARKLK